MSFWTVPHNFKPHKIKKGLKIFGKLVLEEGPMRTYMTEIYWLCDVWCLWVVLALIFHIWDPHLFHADSPLRSPKGQCRFLFCSPFIPALSVRQHPQYPLSTYMVFIPLYADDILSHTHHLHCCILSIGFMQLPEHYKTKTRPEPSHLKKSRIQHSAIHAAKSLVQPDWTHHPSGYKENLHQVSSLFWQPGVWKKHPWAGEQVDHWVKTYLFT